MIIRNVHYSPISFEENHFTSICLPSYFSRHNFWLKTRWKYIYHLFYFLSNLREFKLKNGFFKVKSRRSDQIGTANGKIHHNNIVSVSTIINSEPACSLFSCYLISLSIQGIRRERQTVMNLFQENKWNSSVRQERRKPAKHLHQSYHCTEYHRGENVATWIYGFNFLYFPLLMNSQSTSFLQYSGHANWRLPVGGVGLQWKDSNEWTSRSDFRVSIAWSLQAKSSFLWISYSILAPETV